MKKINMKKIYLGAVLLVMSNAAVGASIDHIQHYTPEYTANPAQNGAINAGTSAYYNPAGLMQIENGRYFQIGVQGAYGKQKQKNDGNTYDADSFDAIPNIMLVDKTDDRAWYFTFGGLAGGAEMEYKNGVPTIAQIPGLADELLGDIGLPIGPDSEVHENYAKGSNTYIQSTLGRAWFVTDRLSMSAAGRVIHGQRNLDVRATGELDIDTPLPNNPKIGISDWMEAERNAWGYGGQFGLNYAATDKLNIGMRYDTRIRMNFRTDTKSQDRNIIDGPIPGLPSGIEGGILDNLYPEYFNKSRRDLPAILALGTQYRVNDMWAVYTSVNYYFNKDADMDREYKSNRTYDNGWDLAVGSEYWLNNKWAWLVGANYADTGANRDSYTDSEFALNSLMLGTGFKYMQNSTTMWTVTIANYWYDSANGEGAAYENVRYKKNYTTGGISLTKKF